MRGRPSQPKRQLIEGDYSNGLFLVGNRLELVTSNAIQKTTVDVTQLYFIFKELFTGDWANKP